MKGELIETINGIEIRRKANPEADPLALVAGRRGRLAKGGPVYEVDRVGEGAAYLHKVFDPPTERAFGPWDELADASGVARNAISEGTPDQAYVAAFKAADIAGQCRRILVSRGPVEPGISKSARFAERV